MIKVQYILQIALLYLPEEHYVDYVSLCNNGGKHYTLNEEALILIVFTVVTCFLSHLGNFWH